MHDEITKISSDMSALGDKVARLETVNAEMESNAEMTWLHLDSMGEDIWRNLSVSEELHGIVEKIGEDMKKV